MSVYARSVTILLALILSQGTARCEEPVPSTDASDSKATADSRTGSARSWSIVAQVPWARASRNRTCGSTRGRR